MKKTTRMLTRRVCAAALGLGVMGLSVAGTPASAAAPEPRPVPTRWEFTFEPGPLRLAWVETENGPAPYFYLTYRVTNF